MLWKTLPITIAKAFVHLIYPPICLHCSQGLHQPDYLLCKSCLDLLEIIDPSQRCQFCFTEDCDPKRRLCAECHGRHSIFEGMGAVFDFIGPAAALVKKMKYSNMPYLSRGAAAYMTTQFCQLNWPMPDLIVP